MFHLRLSGATLLVCTVLVALVLAATTSAESVNCTGLQTISAELKTIYDPPVDCRNAYADLGSCYSSYDACVAQSAESCTNVETCIARVSQCIFNLRANSNVTACTDWEQTFTNFKFYLDMGGSYNGSGLQLSCLMSACALADRAVANTSATQTCPLAVETVCPTPSTPTVYSISFGGDWSSFFSTPALIETIKAHVKKGLARILGFDENLLQILSITQGSLIVEFVVLNGTADTEAISQKLLAASQNTTALAAAFTELAAAAQFPITLTGVSVSVNGQPAAPVTPQPVPSPGTPRFDDNEACDGACIAAIALGGALLLFGLIAVIVCVVRRRKGRKEQHARAKQILDANRIEMRRRRMHEPDFDDWEE